MTSIISESKHVNCSTNGGQRDGRKTPEGLRYSQKPSCRSRDKYRPYGCKPEGSNRQICHRTIVVQSSITMTCMYVCECAPANVNHDRFEERHVSPCTGFRYKNNNKPLKLFSHRKVLVDLKW